MEITSMYKNLENFEKSYKKSDFPETVLVEASAYCNINCVQCANANLKRAKGNMDIHLYKKIVNEVVAYNPNTKFWFAFYGEPLLMKYKLYYMIDYAKRKGLTDTYLNTNATLLTEEVADMLIDSGIDHIIAGIDGYSAEVFESIRRNAKRDEVYNNVITLKRKMREKGVEKPRIEAQFIVMDSNKHEIEQYVDFWKEQQIAIKIRNQVSWSNHVKAGENIIPSLKRVACGWAIGICPITWDGQIVACATDCDAEHPFGNVKEESIQEIWKRKQKFIDAHLSHRFEELPEFCQHCTDWQVIGTEDYDETGNKYKKS